MASWLDRLLKRDSSPGASGDAAHKSSPGAEGGSTSNPGVPHGPPEVLGREQILEALELQPDAKQPERPPVDQALAARVVKQFSETRPVPGSPPQLAMRILTLVSRPDADATELAKLISLEPALTAAVLRVANSAAFRPLGRIGSVREAITRMGLREVARIGCALSAKSVFEPQRRLEQLHYGSVFLDLFVHASTTALASSSLALQMPKLKTNSDAVFLGGLLHDIGMSAGLRVLIATLIAEDPPRALAANTVHQLLDVVHVDIGNDMHREWSLPDSSTAICAGHHLQAPPPGEHLNELHLVRLTSAIHFLQSRPLSDAALLEVEQSAGFLGMNKFQLRSFDADVRRFTGMAQELGR